MRAEKGRVLIPPLDPAVPETYPGPPYPSYTRQGPVCLKVVQVRCFHLNRPFTYIIPLALLFLFYR